MMSAEFNIYSQPSASSHIVANGVTVGFPATPETIWSKNLFGLGQYIPDGNDWTKNPALTPSIPSALLDPKFPVWWLVDSSNYFIAFNGSRWLLYYTATGAPAASVAGEFYCEDGRNFYRRGFEESLSQWKKFSLFADAALTVPYTAPTNTYANLTANGKKLSF